MTPLAIELAPAGGPGQARSGRTAGHLPLRLIARLVRPGKNGGWVGGDLNWGRLDMLRYSGYYREEQVRLLGELYVLYQARAGRGGYYGYPYGDERSIELSSVGSPQLWPLLDEAAAAGLRLVYPGKRGVLAGYGEAEFCLDVTRDPAGGLRIVPVIRAGGEEPVVPVAFIGAEGHGAVCVGRAEAAGSEPGSWRFWLARLTRPVPPPLQQMALGSESLQVPAAEEPRADTSVRRGRLPDCAAPALLGATRALQIGDKYLAAWCLDLFVAAVAAAGDQRRAAAILAAVDTARHAMGIEPDSDDQALRQQVLKLLDQHGQDFLLGHAEGQALDLPAALSLAASADLIPA